MHENFSRRDIPVKLKDTEGLSATRFALNSVAACAKPAEDVVHRPDGW